METKTQYSKFFETKVRHVTGETFVCMSEDEPDELQGLIRQIHCGFDDCFPNDWIYQTVAEAFEALEADPLESLNIEADIYTCQLKKWVLEPYAEMFIDNAMEEGLATNESNFIERVTYGQFLAKERIYYAVADFMEKNNV